MNTPATKPSSQLQKVMGLRAPPTPHGSSDFKLGLRGVFPSSSAAMRRPPLPTALMIPTEFRRALVWFSTGYLFSIESRCADVFVQRELGNPFPFSALDDLRFSSIL